MVVFAKHISANATVLDGESDVQVVDLSTMRNSPPDVRWME